MPPDFHKNPLLEQRPRLRQACLQLERMALELGPEAKLPTMLELRSQLGMSLRTLNDAVRELERCRVLRCINGVGIYVAPAAPADAPRRTGRLGLLLHVHSFGSPYMEELLTGIRHEAARHELEVLLLNDAEAEEPKRVDAVLLYCHVTEALLLNLPPQLPHALLFQHSPEFTCVAPDDFEGARMATAHLLQRGHRRIAYLLSSDHDSVSRRRLAGYRAALAEADLAAPRERVRFLDKPGQLPYRIAGEASMTAWLQDGWHELGCTALLAHNDETAIGVIRALANAGLHVPDDVSVLGFDGTELCEVSTPPLTTIRVPLPEVGATAVRVLAEQMQRGETDPPRKIVLPVQLKTGGSTAVI